MKCDFHPRDWPHGLCCNECAKPISSGVFHTRLTEESVKEIEQQPVAWEGYIPVMEVICDECEQEASRV